MARQAQGGTIDVLPVMKRRLVVESLAVAEGEAVGCTRVEALDVDHEGIVGERHRGFLRPADVRVPWFPRGAVIANERALSIVSREELAEIGERLGLERIEPEWLGANLCITGLPRLSYLPRGTRLFFPSGAVLFVTDANVPCRLVGAEVERQAGTKGVHLALRFVGAAKGRRGVVASVDRPGRLAAGDAVDVRIPEQWLWRD